MDENLKKTGENSGNEKNKVERVKRMRGWLGINSSNHSGNISVDGEAPSYGDAPNGWNR